MPVPKEVYDKLYSAIDANQDKFVARLAEAVAIPSISAEPAHRDDIVTMVHWTKKHLEALGVHTELVDAGIQKDTDGLPLPPVLFGTLGSDPRKKTLLVYGHLDVQPATKEEGWDTDPFVLTEKHGKLYGRGSTDDKGPVICWINAIETMQQLKIELPLNIKFCLEGMEEMGSEGLEEILKHRHGDTVAKRLRDDFLYDVDHVCISDNYWLGKEKPCLTYGLRVYIFVFRGICCYYVEIACAKQDLHSGIFGGTIYEATNDLVWILSKLTDVKGNIKIPGLAELVAPVTEEEKLVYEKIDFDKDDYNRDNGSFGLTKKTKEGVLKNRWRYPSLSIHGMEGAYSGTGFKTIIPAKVTGKFSIRLVPNMTPEETNRLVFQYLNELWATRGSPNTFKARAGDSGKCWSTDFTSDNFQAGARATKRVFGVEPDMTREGGSIPIALTFQELTGKSVLLLPIGACDDMAHSQNEKINRSNYINGTKTLASYILELAQ